MCRNSAQGGRRCPAHQAARRALDRRAALLWGVANTETRAAVGRLPEALQRGSLPERVAYARTHPTPPQDVRLALLYDLPQVALAHAQAATLDAGELAEVLGRQPDEVRVRIAATSTDPKMLAGFHGSCDPAVVRALVDNAHTPRKTLLSLRTLDDRELRDAVDAAAAARVPTADAQAADRRVRAAATRAARATAGMRGPENPVSAPCSGCGGMVMVGEGYERRSRGAATTHHRDGQCPEVPELTPVLRAGGTSMLVLAPAEVVEAAVASGEAVPAQTRAGGTRPTRVASIRRTFDVGGVQWAEGVVVEERRQQRPSPTLAAFDAQVALREDLAQLDADLDAYLHRPAA